MRKLAGMTILAAALTVAGQLGAQEKGATAPYVHAVVFYLKKDAPKDAASTLIEDCHKVLAKIPSVKGVWAGRPAEKATPAVAVTDYSVGLLVLCDNYDGLKEYLDHPMHKEFVARHNKHIERVLVYDFINEKK